VIRSEQRLSKEMAHELRTPLTTVPAEAESASETVQFSSAADRDAVPALEGRPKSTAGWVRL
jgi:signal transduction histidine kinase